MAAADAPDAATSSWPHAIFDLLALTSAFFASVSVSPLLAFSAADYADADARAFKHDPSLSATSVSSGMALWAPLSAVLSSLSLVASVLARMLAELERHVDKSAARRRVWLRRVIWPFALLAALPLAVAIIIFPNSLYYAGFVMFPNDIVHTGRWISMGAVFICVAAVLILGAVGVFLYDRWVLSRLGEGARPQAVAAAPLYGPAAFASAAPADDFGGGGVGGSDWEFRARLAKLRGTP